MLHQEQQESALKGIHILTPEEVYQFVCESCGVTALDRDQVEQVVSLLKNSL